jgi:hypothetical protein
MNASIAVQIALRSPDQFVKVGTPQLAEVKVTKLSRECLAPYRSCPFLLRFLLN